MICRSRNARLSADSRAKAPGIYKALQWAKEAVASGSETNTGNLRDLVSKKIVEAGGVVDYVEVRPAGCGGRRG